MLEDTEKTAQRLCVQKNTLERWRSLGFGPQFVKIGRRVLYRVSDVEAYIDANVCQSTSDKAA
jgi:predicted DNA-binding transcriptional regulator AlpA